MTTRAAIYARFSTDMQNERSIEDQVAVCRAYAEREGYSVVALFEDRATSGASMHGRAGIQDLMIAARDRAFDIVIAESMSRIGRDQEDRASIRKRLTFQGIKLATPSDGVVTPLIDGIRAVIDSQYLDDLKLMIRRGMGGVVREGRSAGGRAYGYRPVPGKPGELIIDEAEASIVRRVLTEYAAGRPPREIAGDLNREGIAPPRGRFWNASTINGNAQRGNGLIFNDLYVGRIVWNKVRMVRDPDTGKRLSRVNPRSEWQTHDVPHLRIVDDELWTAARDVKQAKMRAKSHMKRRPAHLLSGLLKCGTCGGGMSVHDRDKTGKTRIRCSAARENGSCDNRRILYLADVERAVLGGMREQLRDPRMIEVFARKYNEERQRLASDRIASRAKIEARLGEVGREIDRLVRAIAKGEMPGSVAGPLTKDLDAERQRLAFDLSAIEEAPKIISIHPAATAQYLKRVDRLAATLAEHAAAGDDRGSLVADVRALVHAVTVHVSAPRGPFEVEVKGKLAALMEAPVFPAGRHSGGSLVAEEGLEPPTRGL